MTVHSIASALKKTYRFRFIIDYNQNKSNFKTKPYKFSFISPEELEKKLCGAAEAPKEKLVISPLLRTDGVEVMPDDLNQYRRKRSVSQLPPECQNQVLPKYKNWATEGKTAPVQDQGQCGCCYIFSALAVIESRVSIQYKKPPLKYSAQNNLECVKKWNGRDGCGGGR
jgi:C1A family cysteine protease